MSITSSSKLNQLIQSWERDPSIAKNIAYSSICPEKKANFSPIPDQINPVLKNTLRMIGITQLYSHQLESYETAHRGQNFCIVTGTASGKTLCYNIPVLDSLLSDTNSCALYLFPTKALAQDQLMNLQTLLNPSLTISSDSSIVASIYDGDTPTHIKSQIRAHSRIILTNPDMLHLAILPHHTLWARLFKDLRFVVLDEMHIYRGVFGSHIANVIRRLKRVARFYGSKPQFILTSATIANPDDLAHSLIEEPVAVIDQDGSPHGDKYFWLYNPPIVHSELGIRRSASYEAELLAKDILHYNLQGLFFTRTRKSVETLLKNLRENYPDFFHTIYGYRSGYLASERRKIEAGLRNGELNLVISTNALELGIDIGGMQTVLMVGYPGTIASTLQQSGRAGRRTGSSLSVMIASASPLDQFLIKHPEFLLNKSPEQALVNPDNLLILIQHIQCAAFELPFEMDEEFGDISSNDLNEILQILKDSGKLYQSQNKYFWTDTEYPANQISLRSTSSNRIILRNIDGIQNKIIGEVDEPSAYWMTHPNAIYIHDGIPYQVDTLNLEKHEASLHTANVDYYTEPRTDTVIEKLSIMDQKEIPNGEIFFGEIIVTSQVVGFKKINWFTREIIGYEDLDMPTTQLRTTGYWIALNQNIVEELEVQGLWKNTPNKYGPNWPTQRDLARKRDLYRCQSCGISETDKAHHVHHKIPFRNFITYQEANQLNNLITLCPVCHKKAEIVVKMQSGLSGLRHVLSNIAPLFVMCDTTDLGALSDPTSPLTEGKPTIIIYDQIPAGIGLSQTLFKINTNLLSHAYELVSTCTCIDGCPSCVGPAGENGVGGKQETLAILQMLIG